jgi:hypothetical protein
MRSEISPYCPFHVVTPVIAGCGGECGALSHGESGRVGGGRGGGGEGGAAHGVGGRGLHLTVQVTRVQRQRLQLLRHLHATIHN